MTQDKKLGCGKKTAIKVCNKCKATINSLRKDCFICGSKDLWDSVIYGESPISPECRKSEDKNRGWDLTNLDEDKPLSSKIRNAREIIFEEDGIKAKFVAKTKFEIITKDNVAEAVKKLKEFVAIEEGKNCMNCCSTMWIDKEIDKIFGSFEKGEHN